MKKRTFLIGELLSLIVIALLVAAMIKRHYFGDASFNADRTKVEVAN